MANILRKRKALLKKMQSSINYTFQLSKEQIRTAKRGYVELTERDLMHIGEQYLRSLLRGDVEILMEYGNLTESDVDAMLHTEQPLEEIFEEYQDRLADETVSFNAIADAVMMMKHHRRHPVPMMYAEE